jgi:hypothetical protein
MTSTVITDEMVEKALKTWSLHVKEARERGLSHFHIGMAQKVVLEAVAPMILEEAAKVVDQWADAVIAKAPKSTTIVQARMHAGHIRALKEPRP